MLTVIMRRGGARKDHLKVIFESRERWLRTFHIVYLVHLYKLLGRSVQVDGGQLVMEFDDGARKYLDALMCLNPRKFWTFHFKFVGAIEELDKVLSLAIADVLKK